MARPQSKAEIYQQSTALYQALITLINNNPKPLEIPFSFDTVKEKGAHWSRDETVKDVIVHLYEWQRLLLAFLRANQDFPPVPFLPQGYTWKNYGAMNQGFKDDHHDTSLAQALALLDGSHHAVLKWLEAFSDDELFTKRHFSYVGTSNLASYFIANTSSHYTWALTKLKKHIKAIQKNS